MKSIPERLGLLEQLAGEQVAVLREITEFHQGQLRSQGLLRASIEKLSSQAQAFRGQLDEVRTRFDELEDRLAALERRTSPEAN